MREKEIVQIESESIDAITVAMVDAFERLENGKHALGLAIIGLCAAVKTEVPMGVKRYIFELDEMDKPCSDLMTKK